MLFVTSICTTPINRDMHVMRPQSEMWAHGTSACANNMHVATATVRASCGHDVRSLLANFFFSSNGMSSTCHMGGSGGMTTARACKAPANVHVDTKQRVDVPEGAGGLQRARKCLFCTQMAVTCNGRRVWACGGQFLQKTHLRVDPRVRGSPLTRQGPVDAGGVDGIEFSARSRCRKNQYRFFYY